MAYRPSSGGLHWLLESAGIKFLAEGESKCKKHAAERRRPWRKLHIGIDAQTRQVRAICISSNHVSDAAVVPQWLEQLPAAEPLLNVRGEGAYDTQLIYVAVMERKAMPIIAPRERMRGCAKAAPLHIAIRQLPHAGVWDGDYGGAEVAITAEAWYRPRYAASSDWASE